MTVVASQSLDSTAENEGVIIRVSHELQVPLDEVREVYRAQLARFATDARVLSFLGVLATHNTRDILRAIDRRVVSP